MAVAHRSATTTALGGTADRLGDPPALPIRDAAFEVANAAARDGHLEDLGGVGHGQVAEPLGERGTTRAHGELGLERAAKRTPFGVREPNERALTARVGHGRASEVGHDFQISESRALHKTPQTAHRLSVSPRTPLNPQPTPREVTNIELPNRHHCDYHYETDRVNLGVHGIGSGPEVALGLVAVLDECLSG